MKRSTLLASAHILDQIAGDPEWLPHPVRLIGAAIDRGGRALRCSEHSAAMQLGSGALLTATIVISSYCITAQFIRSSYHRSKLAGNTVELVLGWACLAARNLEQETTAVANALACGDLPLARRRLARIVGRDTADFDISEISRAIIETSAESASDGVIAPLLFMALGGVPLAMAYKAVNTLDSMIGHTDAHNFYFGKAAARLDDVANYLPARLTALTVIAASSITGEGDATSAWKIWRRDGGKHKSPNAGQPESAMSGALRVQLGGDNRYDGELIPAQIIGWEFSAPASQHARKAIRITSMVALLGFGCFALLATAIGSRRRH